jgi:hypothetical protein
VCHAWWLLPVFCFIFKKVSFWDAKLAEKTKEKMALDAARHFLDANKAHWSPAKALATNAGAPLDRGAAKMDVPTARHLILHACNDIQRMREAMEVAGGALFDTPSLHAVLFKRRCLLWSPPSFKSSLPPRAASAALLPQVIKAERQAVAVSLDGGVADASTDRCQDEALRWDGLVKGSAFEQAVHQHNEKL